MAIAPYKSSGGGGGAIERMLSTAKLGAGLMSGNPITKMTAAGVAHPESGAGGLASLGGAVFDLMGGGSSTPAPQGMSAFERRFNRGVGGVK